MTIETLEVKQDHMSMDLLLYRRFGYEVRAAVEEAYARNQDLAQLGPILPVGTKVDIEIPTVQQAPVVRVLRLWG